MPIPRHPVPRVAHGAALQFVYFRGSWAGLRHMSDFHHKENEHYRGSSLLLIALDLSTEAPSGPDNLSWCDIPHRWCWQLWGPGAHWTCFRRCRCPQSPERGTEERGSGRECQLPLWSARVGTPLRVTFMSPTYKPGTVTISPSHEMSQGHRGDTDRTLSTHQKHRK